MKRPRKFRPPQGILKSNKPLAIHDIRKIYDDQDSGYRWARRILRQEDILKSAGNGSVSLPEVFDLQFGPQIVMAFHLDADLDEVAKTFEDSRTPVACIPAEDCVITLSPVDSPIDTDDLEKADVDFSTIDCKDAFVIDDTSAPKLKSIMKAGRVSKAESFELESADIPMDADYLFLLNIEDRFTDSAEIVKVDDELGLVFGWAIVSNQNGEPYFDKQDDHIPEDAMLTAAADFMMSDRINGEMHIKEEDGSQEVKKGTIVFAWPLTEEIAKAFNIKTDQTGLMIAAKPDDDVLDKFKDGTYTGFSIGGYKIETEEVE